MQENGIKEGDIISVEVEGGETDGRRKDDPKSESLISKQLPTSNSTATNIITLKVLVKDKDDGSKQHQKSNLNKKVFFLAAKERSIQYYDDKTSYDLFDASNTEMYIDGNKVDFCKSFVFKEIGIHTVKYVIKGEIKTCKNMFCFCYDIIEIDLENFCTSNVTDFTFMFNSCKLLKSVNLSNMNTDNAKDTAYMFQSCSDLSSIDISSFNLDKAEDMLFMFNQCAPKGKIKVKKNAFEKMKKLNAGLPKDWEVEIVLNKI